MKHQRSNTAKSPSLILIALHSFAGCIYHQAMRRCLAVLSFLLLVLAVFANAQTARKAVQPAVKTYTYRVIHTYPHDPLAFTQGLEFREGVIFEGTGYNGRSSL